MISEDVANHFVLTNFATPVSGTLRGVLYNETTPRDKISLNGLGTNKGKSGCAYMMLKTGMEVDQYYIVFKYVAPIPQKKLKYQYRTILVKPGMKPTPKTFLPGHRK